MIHSMLREIWQCRQLSGTFPVEIQSESDPEKMYVVTIDPFANRSELHSCTCNAYRYKGRCKHQKTAHQRICGWNELDGPGELSDKDIERGTCPRCGGPIMKGIWEVNEST